MEPTIDLCPASERRFPQEMYTKLFVIHFTVIVAYGHLMHLRREPRDLFSYLLIIGYPIGGALSLLSPLVVLSVQAVVGVFHGDCAYLMTQSVCILIGEIPENEDDGEFDTSYEWPPKKMSCGAMGRVALLLALLVQCITSIWLFARRVEHGGDALYDHRILQLAILGLSVSSMSIIQVVLKPQYPSCSIARENLLALQWLTCWRPLIVFDDTDSAPDILSGEAPRARNVSEYPLLGVDWIYTSLSLWITPLIGLKGDVLAHVTLSKIWKGVVALIWAMPYLLIVLVPIVVQFRTYLSAQLRKRPKVVIVGSLIGVVAIPLLFCITSILSILIADPFASGFQLWTLLSRPDGWQGYLHRASIPTQPFQLDWKRIWTYGHIPSTIPCPKAWKDPVADRLWGLA